MIPKIEFVYSSIYDEMYRNSQKILEALKKEGREYPSQKEIINYIKKIRITWKKHEVSILKNISKITSLKWKEQKIKVYVIGSGRPFSDPLTTRLYKDKNKFIETLTHELIHQIQIQNKERIKKWWIYIEKRYRKEPRKTKNHISVHAIHSKLIIDLFDKKRLKKEIQSMKHAEDYMKAWQIVQQEGYESIIKKFRELTR